MPNIAALTQVASAATQTAASAASAAGATGAATALSAAIPFVGIAAVAAPFVSNLFSCGTISQIGCVKRNDAQVQQDAILQARQLAYSAELGQITPSAAAAQIQQILQSAPSQDQRASDWTGAPPTPVDVACGSNGNIPSSAMAAQVDCKTIASPQQVVSSLLAYTQTITPPAGSPAASAIASQNPVSAVLNSLGGGSSLPSWVLLAGIGVAIFFLAGNS